MSLGETHGDSVHWIRPWGLGGQRMALEGRPGSPGSETWERADYIWPRRWQSQGGCWDKGHSGSGSTSQVHTLRLKLEVPRAPPPQTRPWWRTVGERSGKETEWKKDANSQCFSALAAEHAWKSRGWIFHTLRTYLLPQSMITFS